MISPKSVNQDYVLSSDNGKYEITISYLDHEFSYAGGNPQFSNIKSQKELEKRLDELINSKIDELAWYQQIRKESRSIQADIQNVLHEKEILMVGRP